MNIQEKNKAILFNITIFESFWNWWLVIEGGARPGDQMQSFSAENFQIEVLFYFKKFFF